MNPWRIRGGPSAGPTNQKKAFERKGFFDEWNFLGCGMLAAMGNMFHDQTHNNYISHSDTASCAYRFAGMCDCLKLKKELRTKKCGQCGEKSADER